MSRMGAFKSAIDEKLLVNQEPSNKTHNERAKLLRNGLAVVGFSALEDFINERASEVLKRIGEMGVPFDSLPEKLRKAATKNVLKAVRFKMRHMDEEGDAIGFIQEQARKIGSTASSAYELSELSLSNGRSNMNHEDVRNMLQVVNVDKPWKQMSEIASTIGIGSPSLEDGFRQAARRRHASAHDSTSDTESAYLNSFYLNAVGVAVGFDLLISEFMRTTRNHEVDYTHDESLIVAEDLSIVSLDLLPSGEWGISADPSQAGYDNHMTLDSDVAQAQTEAIQYCASESAALVVRGGNRIPRMWHTPCS